MAFHTPAATTGQHSPTLSNVPSNSEYDLRTPDLDLLQQNYSPQYPPHVANQVQVPSHSLGPTSYPSEYVVSPSMWQDAVASSFGDRIKRRWNAADAIAPVAKRRG
jgi:hypothetical protein